MAAALLASPVSAWASPADLMRYPGAPSAALERPAPQRPQQLVRAPEPARPVQLPQELAAVAYVTEGPDPHWIVTILEIAALNIAGFWVVQQLVRGALDTSTPVTTVKVRCALRETQHGGGLRKRLGEMRELSAMGPEGLWLTLEEAVSEICKRQGSVAYAEASAEYFKSQNAALDAFKRLAAREAARTDAEELEHVSPDMPDKCGVDWEKEVHPLQSMLPQPLQSLFGAGDVDDSCQEMVVVTLVVTARGVLDIPPVTNWPTLRHALQQVSGVSRSSIMAIELLWSPDNAEDYLSAADVTEDYPNLVNLATGRRVGRAANEAPAAAAAGAGAGMA